MKNEKLLGAIGKIDDNLIHDAVNDTQKKKRLPWVKFGSIAACFALMIVAGVMLLQQNHTLPGDNDLVTAPMIIINDKSYVAPNMPVSELPAEYHYLRDLTEEEANNTGLEGCAIYVNPQDDEMSTIYLYQECGTPIDQYTVDNTQRQWAYVAWIINDSQS